jgi:DNA-binding XRE family transcriptional regulator
MSGHVPRPPGQGQDPPARHLRIVPKDPPPKPPRKKHHRTPTFTPEEQARLRAALNNARPMLGTWACLADAMRVNEDSLKQVVRGRKNVSGDLVIRLARALGVPVESLYRTPTDASTCLMCGARRGR